MEPSHTAFNVTSIFSHNSWSPPMGSLTQMTGSDRTDWQVSSILTCHGWHRQERVSVSRMKLNQQLSNALKEGRVNISCPLGDLHRADAFLMDITEAAECTGGLMTYQKWLYKAANCHAYKIKTVFENRQLVKGDTVWFHWLNDAKPNQIPSSQLFKVPDHRGLVGNVDWSLWLSATLHE